MKFNEIISLQKSCLCLVFAMLVLITHLQTCFVRYSWHNYNVWVNMCAFRNKQIQWQKLIAVAKRVVLGVKCYPFEHIHSPIRRRKASYFMANYEFGQIFSQKVSYCIAKYEWVAGMLYQIYTLNKNYIYSLF